MKKLTWKEVFNCSNVFPEPFHKCKEIAKSVGYKYMSFNGFVCSVEADSTSEFILMEDDL